MIFFSSAFFQIQWVGAAPRVGETLYKGNNQGKHDGPVRDTSTEGMNSALLEHGITCERKGKLLIDSKFYIGELLGKEMG